MKRVYKVAKCINTCYKADKVAFCADNLKLDIGSYKCRFGETHVLQEQVDPDEQEVDTGLNLVLKANPHLDPSDIKPWHKRAFIKQLAEAAASDTESAKITDPVRTIEPIRKAAAEDRYDRLRAHYDDAVIAVALYNYETFHGLEHGTAFFEHVVDTSAGIAGWAAAILEAPISRGGSSEDTTVAKQEVSVPARGDKEEACLLQLALLESVGACPKHTWQNEKPRISSNEDDDGDEPYYYSDDECFDNSDSDGDEKEEPGENISKNHLQESGQVEYKKGVQKSQEKDSVPPTIRKSSWQFQQLMRHVDQSGVCERRDEKASTSGTIATVAKKHKSPVKTSQSVLGSEGGSWSQLSYESDSSGLLVERPQKESCGVQKSRGDWQHIDMPGKATTLEAADRAEEDEWSEVSNEEIQDG